MCKLTVRDKIEQSLWLIYSTLDAIPSIFLCPAAGCQHKSPGDLVGGREGENSINTCACMYMQCAVSIVCVPTTTCECVYMCLCVYVSV